MKVLKSIFSTMHLKLDPFFDKIGLFFNDKNIIITKKYIFLNLIFSPVILVFLFNIICLSKFLFFHITIKTQIPVVIHALIFIPYLSFIMFILTYGIFIYRTKSLFVAITGSNYIKFLIIGFSLIFLSIPFKFFNPIIFIFLSLMNLIFIVFAFINKGEFIGHFHNLKDSSKFKLIFADVGHDLSGVVTFLNNMKVFYHHDYIMLDGYKLSYQDSNIFENQFNKKVYDFNQDEINVVTMYALN